MPNGKKSSSTAKGGAALRVPRHATWKALHAAAIEWCWCRVELEIGGPAPRETWAASFREPDDEPLKLWRDVRDAMNAAIVYLDATPDGSRDVYAHMLDELVSFRCYHKIGAEPATLENRRSRGTVRGMLRGWADFPARPASASVRSRIVAESKLWTLFGRAWWWRDRPPKVRDLAILSLLAGNVPEAARNACASAKSEAARPTVADVVKAEENAIRATQTAHAKRKRDASLAR